MDSLSAFFIKSVNFTFQPGYIQIKPVDFDQFLFLKLYIPTWLYSNTDSKQLIKILIPLYIPTWLYSNS